MSVHNLSKCCCAVMIYVYSISSLVQTGGIKKQNNRKNSQHIIYCNWSIHFLNYSTRLFMAAHFNVKCSKKKDNDANTPTEFERLTTSTDKVKWSNSFPGGRYDDPVNTFSPLQVVELLLSLQKDKKPHLTFSSGVTSPPRDLSCPPAAPLTLFKNTLFEQARAEWHNI